jgi:hypothetical protein
VLESPNVAAPAECADVASVDCAIALVNCDVVAAVASADCAGVSVL